MATFPESMDRLDVQNPASSLSIVENYIRYMCERTEFAMRNMTKIVSAAGVSSAEVYVLVQAMSQTLAALQSTVNQLNGQVNSISGQVATLRSEISSVQLQIASLESSINGINESISSLDRRVTALEQAETSTEG